MAFAAGHRVDDAAAHAAGGVRRRERGPLVSRAQRGDEKGPFRRPREVANALVMILAGLACEHGLVHADPHGGNALVETGPNGTFTRRGRRFDRRGKVCNASSDELPYSVSLLTQMF